MSTPSDRLYGLLPAIYRKRDFELDYPLRALLAVIEEQVDVVEDDIAALYDNWFIETCDEWVVPYLASLIGYVPGEVTGSTARGAAQGARVTVPRREVANTIRNRQRKGTLRLLEELAAEVADWPAHATEFYRRLNLFQSLNHLQLARGRTVDLRWGDAIDQLGSAFDRLARTVDVRRIGSRHRRGRYNIPNVGVFVWRLKVYSVTRSPAYRVDDEAAHGYSFSILGNDAPLYTGSGTMAAARGGERHYPAPIRRHALEEHLQAYYGEPKSFQVWAGDEAVDADRIVVADLTDWHYRPRHDKVAVDPVLGRIAFAPDALPVEPVRVSYNYAFSDDLGGGEYGRDLTTPPLTYRYGVGGPAGLATINDALARWDADGRPPAIIEIDDSRLYVEPLAIDLRADDHLELRAGNRRRPVIRPASGRPHANALSISGDTGSRFVLDGLMVWGRGMVVQGPLSHVVVRHSTLVPGSGLFRSGQPRRPRESSLELNQTTARITIERSILGAVRVREEGVATDPVRIEVIDSIIDATDSRLAAVSAGDEELRAWAKLRLMNSTVFGELRVHMIELIENSLVSGLIDVGRRQAGCARFSYIRPGSRTPRRYHCQPDLVVRAVEERIERGDLTAAEARDALREERRRVRPRFNSIRYGTPTYAQLADDCAREIVRGADDESEMGVFHDLYQPQREANLQARLDDYVPIGMEAAIIHSS